MNESHVYGVGYAYPSSDIAYKLGRGATGTWYVQIDKGVHRMPTATLAAEYVQAGIDAGGVRHPYCQTTTPAWSTIIENERKIQAEILRAQLARPLTSEEMEYEERNYNMHRNSVANIG